jgi:hypothetical protein
MASVVMFATVAAPLSFLGYGFAMVVLFVFVGVAVLLVSLRIARAVPSGIAAILVHSLPQWAAFLRPAVCWVTNCSTCDHATEWTGPTAAVDVPPKVF